MVKRGSSGLSCVVGIHKEPTLSSHDVVNRCRWIFSEKRVGHAGTLDPAASGVLLVCVGPATRLNPYLSAHDKTYRFKVCFGSATDTDDAEGRIIDKKPIPHCLSDVEYAQKVLAALVGKNTQKPPVYSAIKIDGERAYKTARSGKIPQLAYREIEIYSAKLVSIDSDFSQCLTWEIIVKVSKGSYIRSLARDLGESLGTCAHVCELERIASGSLSLEKCINLEALEQSPQNFYLDPVFLLGYKYAHLNEAQSISVKNGSALSLESLKLRTFQPSDTLNVSAYDNPVIPNPETRIEHDELISLIADEKLHALYRYDEQSFTLYPQCVFSTGVSRGLNY